MDVGHPLVASSRRTLFPLFRWLVFSSMICVAAGTAWDTRSLSGFVRTVKAADLEWSPKLGESLLAPVRSQPTKDTWPESQPRATDAVIGQHRRYQATTGLRIAAFAEVGQLRRKKMPKEPGRMFTCGWCNELAVVCRSCDYGQRYCGDACREPARHESVKRANQQYSRSRKGRMKTAERKRAFRMRAKLSDQKGTDHPVTQGCEQPTMLSESRGNEISSFVPQEDILDDTENTIREDPTPIPSCDDSEGSNEMPSTDSSTALESREFEFHAHAELEGTAKSKGNGQPCKSDCCMVCGSRVDTVRPNNSRDGTRSRPRDTPKKSRCARPPCGPRFRKAHKRIPPCFVLQRDP